MTFPHTSPIVAQCESLDEVRIRIDQADRQLVALLAERAQYVRQAARFKRDAQDVQAPQRVQQVMSRALDQARDIGAPPAVVEATYRAMIAAFIEDEGRHVAQRNATLAPTPTPEAEGPGPQLSAGSSPCASAAHP